MSTVELTTLKYYPKGDAWRRLFALWYFTPLIVLWNLLGHTVFGFDQAWMHPLIGVTTAILVQMAFDWIDARANQRPVRFTQSLGAFVNFLPPAIIPGMACSMLLFPNEQVWPLVFAVTLSITSKILFRAPVGGGKTQHIFNPSNFGIAATLLLMPSIVGVAPPYHFTTNVTGVWHWVLPGFVLVTGIIVHALFTGRLPLCLAWVIGFVCQGLLRKLYFGTPWATPLAPMTSAAFIVFTLYMIPDPATTPLNRSRQVLFGLAVAAVYGVLQVLHVVFGLFFALVIVCAVRAAGLYLIAFREKLSAARAVSLQGVENGNGTAESSQPRVVVDVGGERSRVEGS